MTLLKTTEDVASDSLAETIRKRFVRLGITDVKMMPEVPGPVVTAYPLRVSFTPVNKVIARSEDIALACNVDSVDIRRVGGEIVVFVPNKDRRIVDFKENLFWYLQDPDVAKMKLPIPLGIDFHGNKTAIDLTEQPHILIAGSTGSGKSVTESNIIASLSMFLSPDELHLVLVDTKKTDLVHFENLPHVKNIVREIYEWEVTIQSLIREVDSRTALFAHAGTRNISEYNAKMGEGRKMPYIVLIIDEFADLNVRGKQMDIKVDLAVGRLTQISRAAGIHVILCTQRSSVKVIYGDLKANFPTRIALKLPSAIDSRTILDEGGAENLLGKGDMLVKSEGFDELRRFHAPFVRLEDIHAVLHDREMILQMINRPRLET